MIFRKLLLLSSLVFLLTGSAWGQIGVRKDDIVLTSRGSPAGGASISICTTGLPTTGAQVIGGSIAVLTFGSSPISAGFVTGMGLTVSGFTGADSFLNGSYTIASVTTTTVSYTLTHSNYTASSNGIAFQPGNASTPCAPLAQIFSDGNLTVPIAQPGLTTDGIGNYGYWAAPGQYMAQFGGPVLTAKVLPVTLSVPPGGTISNATNLVGPGSITGTFSGSPTLSGQLNSSVATGTAPFSIASTTAVPNLNAQLHGGLAAPASAILGLTDSQAPTNKTIDISLNTLKSSSNTAGHVPRNNGTQYVDGQLAAADLSNGVIGSGAVTLATAIQGTDANALSSGTVSASTGVPLCTDANHGATTSGCTAGGVTESTLSWGSVAITLSGTTVCPTTVGNWCVETVFAKAHTLVRLTYTVTIAAVGCSTNAQVGLKDVTASSVLSSLTVNQAATTFVDSGALSVAMTAGDTFVLGLTTGPSGCSTAPAIVGLTAVFQ